ncbi:hypothetical protein [Ktedonobacter racemifer]|uniref:Uncharacterized protein n=1 Tax=Ktedonobacter racemifer DSM 44963 TaxID=485913 RepID=D6U8Y8_KTERA|nr:hypothetical protein [Ktedonobacter racemifer]EFH79543.1 hypothetical protein Krac_0053 [Ktedonobacter racemifer DSM 44963]
MAQSEQARLISSLMGKGYSMKDIAALTGRTPRYIGFARDSETKIGRGGKETHGKGQNLIPALRQLDEKGKLSPAEMPGRRTTKSGAVAKVRKGTTVTTTRRGVQHTRTTVKKGPATIRRALQDAAKNNKRVRWDVNFKKGKTTSDPNKRNMWASGAPYGGMSAQDLLNRIDNPQSGDNWRAGDVNGALASLAIQQSPGVVSATGPQEYNLFTTDN